MKKVNKIIVSGILSLSMIAGSGLSVIASDSENSLLGSVLGFAQSVANSLTDEEKAEIMNGISELITDEDVQEVLSGIIDAVPEEQQVEIFNMISGMIGAGLGTESMAEDLSDIKMLTHDDVLEMTGIDLPVVDDCFYSVSYTTDEQPFAAALYTTDDAFYILKECATGETDLDAAVKTFDVEDAAAEGFDSASIYNFDAYYLIEEEDGEYLGRMLWLEPAAGIIYDISVQGLPESGIVVDNPDTLVELIESQVSPAQGND